MLAITTGSSSAYHNSIKMGSNTFSAQRWKFVPDQLNMKTNTKFFMLWKCTVPTSVPVTDLLTKILSLSSLHLQQHLLSSLLAYKCHPPVPYLLPLNRSSLPEFFLSHFLLWLQRFSVQCPPTRLKTDSWFQATGSQRYTVHQELGPNPGKRQQTSFSRDLESLRIYKSSWFLPPFLSFTNTFHSSFFTKLNKLPCTAGKRKQHTTTTDFSV